MTQYRHTPSLTLLLALASAVWPHASLAEDLTAHGPVPFAAFDRDGNGSISEQEFDAVRAQRMAKRAAEGTPMRGAADAPSFAELDSNGDGRLSPAELSAGQQSQMQKRHSAGMGMGQGMAHGMGRHKNMPAFTDFDLNADGRIDAEEFEQARNARIAERAQQGYMMKNLANAPTFEALDSDGDGAISPAEFSAHQAQRRQQTSP